MFRPKEQPKPYQYLDTPLGEDIDKKLWVVLKPTTLSALAISLVDIMLYSHPKNYLKAVSRIAYISTPFFGMTTAFVLVSNFSAKVRDKDDKVSWILGGVAAGAVLGAWCKNRMTMFNCGILLGFAAYLKKASIDTNVPLVNFDFRKIESGLFTQDFSLIPHIAGNWTTGEEKKKPLTESVKHLILVDEKSEDMEDEEDLVFEETDEEDDSDSEDSDGDDDYEDEDEEE